MAFLGDISRAPAITVERSSMAIPAAPWPDVGQALMAIPPKQGGGGEEGGDGDNFYGSA